MLDLNEVVDCSELMVLVIEPCPGATLPPSSGSAEEPFGAEVVLSVVPGTEVMAGFELKSSPVLVNPEDDEVLADGLVI